jgi:hypothetical protein
LEVEVTADVSSSPDSSGETTLALRNGTGIVEWHDARLPMDRLELASTVSAGGIRGPSHMASQSGGRESSWQAVPGSARRQASTREGS